MKFETKIPIEVAQQEVEDLLDKKNIKPKRRADLEGVIDVVVEAISLGLVAINEDGSIKQLLITPVGESGTLTEINYKARVEPIAINNKLTALKGESAANPRMLSMVYMQAYTGLLAAQINNLEPSDRETANSIISFFL